MLKSVAKVLKGPLRSHRDVAARLGGEEFAVLCFGELDQALLGLIAERIREQLKKEAIPIKRGNLHFTASFGISMGDATDAGWKHIYARADAALYEAKASGKDRVHFGKTYVPGATGRFRTLRVVTKQ